MKMTLPQFGLEEVEIDPSTLIEFPIEMPGLEGCKHFKLFHSGDNPKIFWLQSIDDPAVVLSLTDPDSLQVFYELTLSDEELRALQVEADDELQIAVILARQEDSNIATQRAVRANLETPLVINVTRQLALQKSLHLDTSGIRIYQSLPETQPVQTPSAKELTEAFMAHSFARESVAALAL
jgi:flagellar assembly factor FliW